MCNKLILLFAFALSYFPANADSLRLHYRFPAKDWMNEALPIGNGYMGAMLFGGVPQDEIQISEESFWSGGPGAGQHYNGGNKKESWKYLPQIREHLLNGDKKNAARLAQQHMTGKTFPTTAGDQFGNYGSNQGFGSLFVTLEHKDTNYTAYSRSLNLKNAVSDVTYTLSGTTFNNQYFASYPARLIILRYTNDNPAGMDYSLAFNSIHPNTTFRETKKNILSIQGKLASNNLPFQGQILVRTDGKTAMKNGRYTIAKATHIELYISVATAYLNQYPDYIGNDYQAANRNAIQKASGSTYSALLNEHIADYTALFGRVQLNLGTSPHTALPTNERQQLYSRGAYDPGLEVLYFQYGRYLLISSSRPGTLPAHLQGRWNHQLNPPWACDYHMNINLQMNYWPAEVTNLSECHTPLLEYIDKLREPGRITAREYFNARGWSVHTMNNAYGFTAPGWDFYWGYAPNSAAWLCRHLWEHFLYTGDTIFLKNKAWPIMKETGEFWLDYLSYNKDSTLVSSPSYSPEHGDIAIGAAIDQEICWELFTNLLDASGYIETNRGFLDSISIAREKLSPLKIGKYGQLQEWKEDIDNPQNRHRHISHLYALYPGYQISPSATPKLAEAAKRSLIYRGEEGTGWSLAWKINFWARLLDGNRSYAMLRNILRPSVSTPTYRNPSGSGSYTNLLCAHPPFQIDGNLGTVAGIAEMLLQSHVGTIDILPALPNSWPHGSVKGLKARGGFTVDIYWQNGLLQKVTITSGHANTCTLKYKDKIKKLQFDKAESRTIRF